MAKAKKKAPAKKKGLGIKIPKNALKKGREDFENDDDFNKIDLEPGTYLGAVVDGRGVDTNNGPQIVFDVKVGGDNIDEEDKGGKTSLWFSFDENRVKWLFRFLSMLGYEVDELDEEMLAEALEDIRESKPVVRLSAVRKGEYVNVKATKLLDDVTAEEILGESEGEEEEKDDEEEDEEDDEEEEEKDDEEDEDELDEMSRAELKRHIIADKKLRKKITVKKSMSDDDIRDAIRQNS